MSSGPRRDNGNAYLASLRKVQHQLGTVIASLNRSRLGSASTGSFLDNASKFLQILAAVVGALWVLNDYKEFKKQNNELVNQQLRLANDTAQLTQSSIDINNKLNQLKLVRSTEGRLNVTTDASVVRLSKFDDGTFLYRFQVRIEAKNISDSRVNIPALDIEVFSGSLPGDNIQTGKAIVIDQPYSWLEHATPGNTTWTRLAAYTQRFPQLDDELEKLNADFPRISGGLPGDIDPNESHDWSAEFFLRARPTDMWPA